MKESRHPHPHIDPRQPRDRTSPQTNPPVFAWKPPEGDVKIHISGTHPPVYQTVSIDTKGGYTLLVASDPDFNTLVINLSGLKDSLFLPHKALQRGSYWWKWTVGEATSEVFEFQITQEAIIIEVPESDQWLERLPQEHPRIHIRPEEIADLQESMKSDRQQELSLLVEEADSLLQQPHEYAEPEFLPDRNVDYTKFWAIWYPTMWGTRRFVKGAEVLGLAYLATGNEGYGLAACQRILSVCKWDPEGSSYLGHNDEAHMSVLWNGPVACDWVWNLFSEEEKLSVIEQYRKRGEMTFNHMHDQGCYGINRFDSHAGREIVFLAQLAFVFHDHIPEARKWLEWLRPVLCGIWPVWAGDDGAWAEGISYSNPYVSIMSRFASILKKGTDIDLYKRPFWKNYLKWKQAAFPPYAEWMGFGDHTERWEASWTGTADLSELIARETNSPEFLPYVSEFRREAALSEKTPSDRSMGRINTTLFLAPKISTEAQTETTSTSETNISHVFPTAGWAAIRTGMDKGDDDVAFIFRSSPFGSFSHSHANNNDFIIHVGGKVMAMPTGYYSGYGSPHHAHWVWHTKANNCITLSDAPQLMRSLESRGFVEAHFENEDLVYFQGNADLSYRLQAQRCRRHVIFVKSQSYFFLVDEFIAQPDITSSVQWNIHSWNSFDVSEDQKSFKITRDESVLEGHFLYNHVSFISLGDGWNPPPSKGKPNKQWHNQYHLRFTPVAFSAKRNLGVILAPSYPGLKAPDVSSKREGEAEIATIGDDLVAVNQADEMEVADLTTNAIALIRTNGSLYEISVEGIRLRKE
ncbi:MAG: DUF4962 domain-containing protein [Opitutaceae bacterium]|nr:DUF4962 domain-containing protein [Opitutaceae bacterium]